MENSGFKHRLRHNTCKYPYQLSYVFDSHFSCHFIDYLQIPKSVFGWGNVLRECNVMREFKYFEVNSIVWMEECNVMLRKCNVMREFKYFEVNCLEF
jgi:hypothetical protein